MFPTRLAAGLLSATLACNALAADFNFKFQSSDPSGVKNFEIQQAWADRVEAMTGGRIEIDLLPVGSVVSHTETLGAMKMGEGSRRPNSSMDRSRSEQSTSIRGTIPQS